MQEVLNSQLLDLNFSLSEYSFVGIGREDGKKKGEFCPIFFNKYRFELIESETFWLSETPEKISVGWDAALERICTYARFMDLENNKEFLENANVFGFSYGTLKREVMLKKDVTIPRHE